MLLSSVLLLARVNLVHEPQTNHFNKRTFVVCEGKEGRRAKVQKGGGGAGQLVKWRLARL